MLLYAIKSLLEVDVIDIRRLFPVLKVRVCSVQDLPLRNPACSSQSVRMVYTILQSVQQCTAEYIGTNVLALPLPLLFEIWL